MSVRGISRNRALFLPSILGIAIVLTTPVSAIAQGTADSAGVGSQFELAFWQAVAGSNDPAQFEAYLQRYPQGTFAALAKLKIQTLRPAPAAAPAAPAPAPAPAPVAATAALPAVPASAPEAAPQPEAAKTALPVRPTLAPFRPIEIPTGFCTQQARDDFYTGIFRPAADAATDNNGKANAYLQALQAQFDQHQKSGDTAGATAAAQEAAAYKEIADAAFSISNDFQAKYDAMMKMPIGGCK